MSLNNDKNISDDTNGKMKFRISLGALIRKRMIMQIKIFAQTYDLDFKYVEDQGIFESDYICVLIGAKRNLLKAKQFIEKMANLDE